MHREDMLKAIQHILQNNTDPKVAAVKVYDFWAVSPSYMIKNGVLVRSEEHTSELSHT